MQRCKALIPAALALVLLAGCGSSGVGDILGGGGNDQQANSYEIRGTVDSVDVNGRSVFLTNVTGLNRSMLSSGGGSTARVYFDDRTAVEWQGRTYRPEDLERGDQVAIRVDESGNRLMADSMTVTYNNAGGMTSGSNFPSGGYNSTLRGTVRYVDTSRRTIEVDRGTGAAMLVEFDANTPVYFNNSTFRVADLERGDEIEIRTRDIGSGRLVATDINVIRSVSGNGTFNNGTSSSNMQTIRGTVRYVDTSRRTIELTSPTWVSGFNQGAGGSTMIISYDTNTNVDVNGQLHPVSGLERGDVIEVRVRHMGGSSYFADRVFLVRDVRQ